MPFRFKASESVEHGVHRIVLEQIDRAIGEINDPELDRHEAVHQVRKRCKKIRGVLRLIRTSLQSSYRLENAWFRDAARELSYVRDAKAIIETHDALMATFADQLDVKRFDSVRAALLRRRQRVANNLAGINRRLREIRSRMTTARQRVREWKLATTESNAVSGGLTLTYRRGRKAMVECGRNPGTESFHEWRKRAKYHWYHVRLLRDIWRPVMRRVRGEVKRLSDLLGVDHDLAVYRATLSRNPAEFGSKRDLQALIGLIDRRSAELRAKAFHLGQRVHAEKPKRMCRRFRTYWEVWRREVNQSTVAANHKPTRNGRR